MNNPSSSSNGILPGAAADPSTSAAGGSGAGPSTSSEGSGGSSKLLFPSAEVGAQVLDKKRLGELVKEVDPLEQLDEDVEDMLLHIADDFIEQTISASFALAKHRKAATIDVKDVQLVLGQFISTILF